MESEELLTKEQMIFKAKRCFCEFCNGYGFTVSYFSFYDKQKTSSYDTCIACKGTGLHRSWRYVERTAIQKLTNAENIYLSITDDFTAEQIRGLSKKNLRHLHQKKKMSIIEIAEHLNMSPGLIRKRFKFHGIKIQYIKSINKNRKLDKVLRNDIRKYVNRYHSLPFKTKEYHQGQSEPRSAIVLNGFPHCRETYRQHFGNIEDMKKKCGIKKYSNVVWEVI